MKAIIIVLIVAALGIVALQKGVLKPAPPPPPPPPPPPAILSEPAPVIGEAELQKVLRSAQDPDADVRWEAVVFLDKVKSPRALPLMHEMLQRDQEPQLRIKIINLLGERRGPDITKALVHSLGDMEPDVRLAALLAIEKIGDYSVASAITSGPIRDHDERVRIQAMKTLNSLQDRKQKEIEEARRSYEAQKAAAEAQPSQ